MSTVTCVVKGSHTVSRNECTVYVTPLQEGNDLERHDKEVGEQEKLRQMCKTVFSHGDYWLYHRFFADESTESVLEKRPEEKIWQVVKETR